MDVIQSLASSDYCRIASASDTVLHSECAYTFHSPYTTKEGILVNLATFIGTIPSLAFTQPTMTTTEDHRPALFLRIVKQRMEKRTIEDDGPIEPSDGGSLEQKSEAVAVVVAVPAKLALGGEGGFKTDDETYETIATYSIVAMKASPPTILAELPYNDDSKKAFPEWVQKSADSVIHHAGMAIQQDLVAWQADDEIPVTKYYHDLEFLDNGVTISPDPKQWKCQKRGDTENLWLNLSDGYIGGGRQHWDGSGGSNGALDHYQETDQKYPLVVKLGTITADVNGVHADCYSYAPDEDGPVQIPNLAELLAKRGIQVAQL